MGAGSGGGYASSPSSSAAFHRNVERLASRFPRDRQGRFGKPGRRPGVQVVRSPDPGKTASGSFLAISVGVNLF